MKHGDVFYYEFQPPDKPRPVVILTRTSAIGFLQSVTIAPITSTIRGIPTEVVLTPAEGFANDSAVSLDNIQTVPKAKLKAYVTHLSPVKLKGLHRAISFALGFDIEE
ncbi:MAG: type II toxin-antitoxin system PemK/MazF family toxin [Roseiflexaceae bacterium]|nr:type II toxin-antitoxin system PemK/MazF family toxin [Roseiflexaceae bacterium]